MRENTFRASTNMHVYVVKPHGLYLYVSTAPPSGGTKILNHLTTEEHKTTSQFSSRTKNGLSFLTTKQFLVSSPELSVDWLTAKMTQKNCNFKLPMLRRAYCCKTAKQTEQRIVWLGLYSPTAPVKTFRIERLFHSFATLQSFTGII